MGKNLTKLYKHNTLFTYVKNSEITSLQMLNSGSLVEVGYSEFIGFFILLDDSVIVFETIPAYIDFAEKNLTFIGAI